MRNIISLGLSEREDEMAPLGASLAEMNFVVPGADSSWAMRWPAPITLTSPNSSTRIFAHFRITPNFDASHAQSRAGFLLIEKFFDRCGTECRGWLTFFELRNHVVGLIKF